MLIEMISRRTPCRSASGCELAVAEVAVESNQLEDLKLWGFRLEERSSMRISGNRSYWQSIILVSSAVVSIRLGISTQRTDQKHI